MWDPQHGEGLQPPPQPSACWRWCAGGWRAHVCRNMSVLKYFFLFNPISKATNKGTIEYPWV